MTTFALVAALMCVAACLIVLRPLLWPAIPATAAVDLAALTRSHEELLRRRRDGALDEVAYGAARTALALHLLDLALQPAPVQDQRPSGRRLMLATVVFVPFLALPVYWLVGTPAVLSAAADNDAPLTPEAAQAQMQERIRALETRLAATPQDGQGWATLGRSHAALGDYANAVAAYARADPLLPNDAQLLSDYADALAMAQGRRLEGAPTRLLARALAAAPDNIKALLLAGTADFEGGQFARAVERWERVLVLAPQDTELVNSLQRSIDEARAKLAGGAPAAPAAGTASAGAAGAGGAEAVSGRISLAAGIAAGAAPDDTVFVFARAAQGPRMPLAAFKLKVRDLPADFRLDDSMAMTPAAKISAAAEVLVTARVSKSGDPIPKPGDLEGTSGPVKPGDAGIRLEIREIVK